MTVKHFLAYVDPRRPTMWRHACSGATWAGYGPEWPNTHGHPDPAKTTCKACKKTGMWEAAKKLGYETIAAQQKEQMQDYCSRVWISFETEMKRALGDRPGSAGLADNLLEFTNKPTDMCSTALMEEFVSYLRGRNNKQEDREASHTALKNKYEAVMEFAQRMGGGFPGAFPGFYRPPPGW